MQKEILIQTKSLMKTFQTGDTTQHIINDLDIEIYKNDFTVIMGSSGAGKSTLLYALSGMDRPTSGHIYIDGTDITTLSPDRLAEFRADHFGFVFQQNCLIDSMSIMDNVLVAGLVKKQDKKALIERANALFDVVEVLPHTRAKLPSQISGGRAQRVGVVRALINSPEILFADEPTGALNSKTSGEVLDTFSKFHAEGQSIVMVTHDVKTALRGNRVIYMRDGKVAGECALPPYQGEDAGRRKQLTDFLEKMEW